MVWYGMVWYGMIWYRMTYQEVVSKTIDNCACQTVLRTQGSVDKRAYICASLLCYSCETNGSISEYEFGVSRSGSSTVESCMLQLLVNTNGFAVRTCLNMTNKWSADSKSTYFRRILQWFLHPVMVPPCVCIQERFNNLFIPIPKKRLTMYSYLYPYPRTV